MQYSLLFSFIFLLTACAAVTMIEPTDLGRIPASENTSKAKVEQSGQKIKGPDITSTGEHKSISYDDGHGNLEEAVVDSVTPKEEVEIVSVKERNEDWTEFILNYDKKLFDFWINYFTKRERELFMRQMANAARVRNVVRRVFDQEELPTDLFYVGLIESGFNMHIKSRANAVGPWQFIKGTGVRYGMRVDNEVDERRNIHKATHGAARYFKDLYNIFGSWELALCAYNAGEYKIINAIRKGNTRDYRELVKKKLLPIETVYYIPKVVAAKELYENYKKYELPDNSESVEEGRIYENAKSISISTKFSLASLSQEIGVPLDAMEMLNPDLKGKGIAASRRKPFELFIPENVKDGKIDKYREIENVKNNVETEKITTSVYKVGRGESLTEIANRFNVSIQDLVFVNKLKRPKIQVGQKINIPRFQSTSKEYIVKSGDTLLSLSKKFKISIKKIKEYNSLKSDRLKPKQKIFIPIET